MELNKEFIEKFNKTKTKNFYREIFEKYFPNYPKCRICDDVIYYYDSTFRVTKNKEIILHNKSCISSKKVDNIDYYLTCCEDCLINEIPLYETKNKSRIFNTINSMTCYAFDIPENIMKKVHKEKAVTLENLVNKYGKIEGIKKFENYKEKQAYSNSFEYKNKKYEWDKNTYDLFNKSRAVTINNLIKKHGEEVGISKWNDYCDKQRYSTTLDYFINKYGIDEGSKKYNNFVINRIITYYSPISKLLFDNLIKKLNKKYTYFYAEKERWFYSNSSNKYYFLDFYIKELNIGIEFNGDYYHANPLKYKGDYNNFFFDKNITAENIWEKDKIKKDFLDTKLNKLITIWESEFNEFGLEKTIDKIIKEIYE